MALHFTYVSYKMEKLLKTIESEVSTKYFLLHSQETVFNHKYFPVHQCPVETPDKEADQPSFFMGVCYVSQ